MEKEELQYAIEQMRANGGPHTAEGRKVLSWLEELQALRSAWGHSFILLTALAIITALSVLTVTCVTLYVIP